LSPAALQLGALSAEVTPSSIARLAPHPHRDDGSTTATDPQRLGLSA
jgi:hypothetical protein